jgi:hypothetical protein
VAVREVEDWGFDADTVVPTPLPPELIEVEQPEAPVDVHEEPAALPTKEPSRYRTVALLAVFFVVAVEIAWLVALGYGILRAVAW